MKENKLVLRLQVNGKIAEVTQLCFSPNNYRINYDYEDISTIDFLPDREEVIEIINEHLNTK
jgi:hypothetical protein